MSIEKKLLRVALVVLALLLIPFVAMQFSDEVRWDLFDFVVAGVLLTATGVAYELVSQSRTLMYRVAVGISVVTSLLLVWVTLAVGIIGSESNPANLLYLGAVVLAVVGAAIARLRPGKMALVLYATAVAQLLIPLASFVYFRPDFSPGVVAVFGLSTVFCLLYASAGLLFQQSAQAR